MSVGRASRAHRGLSFVRMRYVLVNVNERFIRPSDTIIMYFTLAVRTTGPYVHTESEDERAREKEGNALCPRSIHPPPSERRGCYDRVHHVE